jgi:hypothetical protein
MWMNNALPTDLVTDTGVGVGMDWDEGMISGRKVKVMEEG